MQATDCEIWTFLRDHEDPVVTASEVADEFGVRRQSAHERLQKLAEQGYVGRKKVGPGTAWYVE
jgi:Mn-dependent DtxR family transcriptional regulator